MKNHHDVCRATHAGFLEYKGLSERVRTGCPNTPLMKSPYCQLHAPVIATPTRPPEVSPTDLPQDPVGLIVDKRTTRGSTMYQVRTIFLHTKCGVD